MFHLTTDPIRTEEQILVLRNDRAGALSIFEGWVRDHNEGKSVRSLEYQVYEELAVKEGEKIVAEAKEKFNLHAIRCVHRHGHLGLGDTAVWIGATASHRDDSFKACRYVIDEIKLRLPIWKKEHYVKQDPEWVFCKDHHTHVHFHAEDYYEKQAKLVDQSKLKAARVLIVGAGGLGCPSLTALTTAGVGHIDVVDFDRIGLSNIHRQPLYSPELVGEKKAIIAAQKMKLLNPFIHVHGRDQRLDASNVEALLAGQHVVLDCTDNLATKYLLHDACMKLRIPLVSASIYRFEGQLRTFVPGVSGCLRCLDESVPLDSQMGNCNDFGVLGASVGIIGGMQAQEALSLILNGRNTTTESTLFFDTQTMTPMKIKNAKATECHTCAGEVELLASEFEIDVQAAQAMGALIVDVRDQADEILMTHLKTQTPVAVCCHRGIRSLALVKDLRAQGHQQFFSLKGGASAL